MSKRKLTSYLGSMYPVSKEFKSHLEDDSTLRRQFLKKNASLLIPRMKVDESHYLFKGSCKAFFLNEDNEEQIFMVFTENSIILLPEEFFAGEKNNTTHIVMLEDSELYTITKTQVDHIFEQFPEATPLTNAIRSNIKAFRETHLQILMRKEGLRYGMFCDKFSEFQYKLSDQDICAFLAISRSTLAVGKNSSRIRDRSRRN
ncbi:Crp/Fnr family transcriptional regulator [Pedobacter nyackensis]|uniref:cAMP-binding domain of CRP or a regulatory subunit of cAMP-dependent protein kinases n=1 Tax=Pedobacter nyackensis TaxID=475255 RepID=A0A1W2A0C6_9SPHI|nr:Crp/Fnr family transcriptional regulator [Pedobacter nyackensis]SMC54090.1 cAMP-binding domain of CRP or a regulatory subunit of cAMP-dependent protein kinases [Pedobacter nyackensis]